MADGSPDRLMATESGAGAKRHVTRVVLGVGPLPAIGIFALILSIAR